MHLEIPVTERDHVLGPANASITVVNYADYASPVCHHRHHEMKKVVDQLLHSVQFVYRHFPLVDVHPRALRAAEAAEAAAAQGKFWEMHHHLYTHPEKLEERHLRHYAHEAGLDLERFDREMNSAIYADQILSDYNHSIIYGISGAPTTFINGELYSSTGVDLLAKVQTMLEG